MTEIFEHNVENEKRVTITVTNPLGFHARPAARFVEITGKYVNCQVFVEKDEERVNGKSIMGLMLFAAGPGTDLDIIAVGDGAEDCLKDLVNLFKIDFSKEKT